MAQQLINTGTAALAGDGESIRSAFIKINNNFTELYESGGVDLTNVSSHILPSNNLTYDLGSTSSQWRSLYVGTSTIYIGGTPLTVADGELLVGGNPVQGDTGNIEFRNDSLNSLNGITISNASQTTAATAQITVPANGSGSVSITNSGTSWAFGNDGSLIFPDGSIQTTASRATTSTLFNGTFTFSLNSIGDLTLPTGWRISSNRIDTGLGTTVTSISLITESLSVDRRLEIYSESNRLHLDTQSPTTELYIGDNSQFIALEQNGEIFVSGQNGVSIHGQGANSTSRIVIPGNTDSLSTPVFIINTGSPGVIIRSGATLRNWQFRGSDGALVFPDNTVQTTAWTGSAPTGTITFSTDTLRNTTSLGGRVQIQTASQQGDPDKTWSFDHGGAGSLILTEGSSVRAKHGFNILATEPEFVNFTSINDFDSLSFLDLTNIVIINPEETILAAIDPSTSTCVALTGTTVRIMLNNGIVKNYQLTSTFVGEQNNPYYGLPVWTGTIPNSGISSTSIKEVSIEYSANWRFDTDGNLTFPDGTIQTTAARETTSTLVNGTYTVSLSNVGLTQFPAVSGESLFIQGSEIGSINASIGVSTVNDIILNAGILGNPKQWRFNANGLTTFPDGTTSTGATIFANSSSYKIQTISFGGSPSNVVSTYEFGVASITIPGNGIIYNEGQAGSWALDGVNGMFSFPNNSRISYGLNNAGLTEDDLKIQAINTGNVVISANGADWVFGTDGNLTFPSGSDITFDNSATSYIYGVTGIEFADGTTMTTAVVGGGGVTSITAGTGTFINTSTGAVTIWTTATGGGGSVLEETFESKTSATSVVVHDCTTNRLFYHTNITNTFTANLTNLSLASGEATNVTLVLQQGATARMCNAIQIAGTSTGVTLSWQGSASAPFGNASRIDVISFSILCTATNSYQVLGMMTSFGGA
jgi:hypothetical protein